MYLFVFDVCDPSSDTGRAVVIIQHRYESIARDMFRRHLMRRKRHDLLTALLRVEKITMGAGILHSDVEVGTYDVTKGGL
jgi:hypothetical protein